MTIKKSIGENYKYMDGKDYERKIKGLDKIEKINKFAEDELGDFDSFALIALNNSELGGIEDNDGSLCQGTICMKLGSERDAKHFFENAQSSLTKRASVDDYKSATLGQLIQHLIEAHCEDKKEALKFVRTLGITMAHCDDDSHNIKEKVLFEKQMDELREKLLNEYDLADAILLLGSTVEALDQWKKIRPELEKRQKEKEKND